MCLAKRQYKRQRFSCVADQLYTHSTFFFQLILWNSSYLITAINYSINRFSYFRNLQSNVIIVKMSHTLQVKNHPKPLQQSAASLVKPSQRITVIKGCEKADYNLAIEKANKLSNRYSQGEEVSCNVDLDYFKKYGPGIYLFFVFTKYIALLFCILGIVYLAPIIFNVTKGSGFNSTISSTAVQFAKTTVGNLNPQPQQTSSLDSSTSNNYKLANSIPDLIACFLFLLFYIFWELKSDKLTEQVKKQVNFRCYYTLQLVDFPSEASENDLVQYFSQFGKVKQIAPVRNYSEIISLCQQIYTYEQRKHELLLNQQTTNGGKDDQMLRYYEDKINGTNTKIIEQMKNKEDKIFKYYVVFEEAKVRQTVLKTLRGYDRCCKWGAGQVPQEHLIMGQQLRVKPCHNEPGDIIWQNQHIRWEGRLLRSALQAILVLTLIAATLFIISFLNMTAPSTATTLDTSNYTEVTILNVTNTTIISIWCIEHTSAAAANSALTNLCSPYLNRYYIGLSVGVLISLVVVVVKQILKIVIVKLAKFQRYKQFTEEKISIMSSLFITYICTTALITLVLQANILGISFKYFVAQFVDNDYLKDNVSTLTNYSDFSPFWYVDIGYKITLTWIILAFQVPLINPIISYVMEKYKFWRASKEITQKGMIDGLTPDQFQIEDHYANILLILFVGLAFSAGMPIIILPCAAAFALRYFYFKFIFIRFSKVPQALDEALNQRVLNLLPFALLFHFLFGAWMLGSQDVFAAENSTLDSLASGNSSIMNHLGFIIVRFGNSWHYTICFLVCLAITITKMLVYDLIVETVIEMRNENRIPSWIYKKSNGTGKIVPQPEKGTIQIENPQQEVIPEEELITASYRIQNNPDYFEVLAIMDKFSVQNQ